MASELKAVADYRIKVESVCFCLGYKNSQGFEMALAEVLNQFEKD